MRVLASIRQQKPASSGVLTCRALYLYCDYGGPASGRFGMTFFSGPLLLVEKHLVEADVKF